MKLLFFTLLSWTISSTFQTTFVSAEECSHDVKEKIAETPHRNFQLVKVSSALGEYNLFQTCPNPNNGFEVCLSDDLEALADDASLVVDSQYSSYNPDSIASFAQAIIMLAAVGCAFAVVTVIACCCTCCFKLCCLGKTPKVIVVDGVATPVGYSGTQVFGTYFCLCLFIFSLFILLLLGLTRGNARIDDAFFSVLDAVDGTVDITTNLPDSFINVAIGFLGGTVVPALSNIKETVDSVVDLDSIHNSFNCVRNITTVVNIELVDFFINETNKIEQQLINGINLPQNVLLALQSDLEGISGALNSTLEFVDRVVSDLNAVNLGAVSSDLNDFSLALSSASQSVTSLSTGLEQYVVVEALLQDSVSKLNGILTEFTTQEQADSLVTTANALSTAVAQTMSAEEFITSIDLVAQQLAAFQLTLSPLTISIQDLESKLLALPSPVDAEAVTNDLIDEVNAFNLDGTRNALLEVLQLIPEFGPSLLKLEEVLSTAQFIPCVLEITNVPNLINLELVEIPSDVLSAIDSNLTGLDQRLQDGIDQVTNLLNVLIDTATDAGLEGVISELNETIKSAFDSFQSGFGNITEVVPDLAQPLQDLQDALNSAVIFSSFLLNLNDLETVLSDGVIVLSLSDDEKSEIRLYDKDSLSSIVNDFVAASQKAQNIGIQTSYQCDNSVTVCYTANLPTAANPCGFPSDECGFPFERLTLSQIALTEAGDIFSQNISPQINDLKTALILAQSSIEDVDLSVLEATNLLVSADSQLDSIVPDLEGVSNGISSLFSDLDELIAFDFVPNINFQVFDDIRSNILDFRGTMVDALDAVNEVLDTEQSVYEYLTSDLNELFANYEESKLSGLLQQDGVSVLALYVMDTLTDHLDLLSSKFGTNVSLIGDISSFRADIISGGDILDVVRDKAGIVRKYGGYTYLYEVALKASNGNLSDNIKDDSVNGPGTPVISGFFQNGGITEYSSGMCLTKTCLENEIKMRLSGEGNGYNIPGKNTILGVPYVFGFMVLLIALLVFFFPCVCGNCLAGVSLTLALFLFLLFGGLLFPLVTLFGDTCSGIEGVGEQLLVSGNPGLCNQFNGQLNNGICRIQLDVPGILNETVDVDVPAMFLNFAVGCGAKTSKANSPNGQPVEPVEALYNVLSTQGTANLERVLNKFVTEDIEEAVGVVIRPRLQQAILDIEPNFANNFVSLASSLNQNLGCNKVSVALSDLKSPVCCNGVSALYYSTAMWYTIAFALLCCGLPAGCLAPTRLRDVKKSRQQVNELVNEGIRRVESSPVGQKVAPVAAIVSSSFTGFFFKKADNTQTTSLPNKSEHPVAEEIPESYSRYDGKDRIENML